MKLPSNLLLDILLLSLPSLGFSFPGLVFDLIPTGYEGPHSDAIGRKLQTIEQKCNESRDQYLSSENQAVFQWDCACKEAPNVLDGSISGSYHLTCQSNCGHFCNQEGTVCLKPGFISGFDTNNVNYLFSQTYQYSKGRSEFVERQVLFSAANAPVSCEYTIDEKTCQQCDIVPCTGGTGSPITLQCENIEAGATFDFCANANPAVETGVFEFLSQEDFRTCLAVVPNPSPTPAPETTDPSQSLTEDKSSGPTVTPETTDPSQSSAEDKSSGPTVTNRLVTLLQASALVLIVCL